METVIPRRSIVLVLAALLFSSTTIAGEEDQAREVQADVKRANHALYSGDVDTVLRYTNPTIIRMMGGRDKASQIIRRNVLPKTRVMKVESLTFPAPPRFFEGENNHFVFVPTLSVISVKGTRIESLNFQLGVRSRGGDSWTYVEGSRVNSENVRSLFSDFPVDVEFPSFYRKRL